MKKEIKAAVLSSILASTKALDKLRLLKYILESECTGELEWTLEHTEGDTWTSLLWDGEKVFITLFDYTEGEEYRSEVPYYFYTEFSKCKELPQPYDHNWAEYLKDTYQHMLCGSIEVDEDGHLHICGDEGILRYDDNKYVINRYGRTIECPEFNACFING